MISNERHWPTQRQPQRLAQPYYERSQAMPFRQPLREDTLETRRIQVERKQFLVMLKENPRGRFLRIAEESNGRSNSIIIPAAGLKDFQKLLEEIVNASNQIPELTPSPAPESGDAGQNGIGGL